MKRFLFPAIATCLLMIACGSPSKEQKNESENNSKKDTVLPLQFSRTFKGTIGSDISITLYLTRNGLYTNGDSIVEGSYYYEKVGRLLSVSGKLNKLNEFELIERNDDGNETGKFKGRFISNDSLVGAWSDPKATKTLSFKLGLVTEGVASVTFKNYHKENCSKAEENKKKPMTDDMMSFDTSCSYIDVNLVNISTGNPAIDKNINDTIIGAIIKGRDNKPTTIEGFLNSIDTLGDFDFINDDISCQILTNEKNVLSVSIDEYSYAGGAHPNSYMVYYNFDLSTGKEIFIDDLFKVDYKKTLNPIAEKLFYKKYGEDEVWNFEKGQFDVGSNALITKGGLLFFYNTYELGSYATGIQELFIPYHEIKSLLNPKGACFRFINN